MGSTLSCSGGMVHVLPNGPHLCCHTRVPCAQGNRRSLSHGGISQARGRGAMIGRMGFMGLADEGTIALFLQDSDADWATKAKRYDFPKFDDGGITIQVAKDYDRTLLGQSFRFIHLVPPPTDKGVHLAITWKRPKVWVYLNGELIEIAL